MKAVLMSVQPKWCELIASGKKTVEVRKTKPKLETPFKCYIYCTSSNIHECLIQNESGVKLIYACNYKTAIPFGGQIANGKIIGEFICDKMVWVLAHPNVFAGHPLFYSQAIKDACLTQDEVEKYSGGKDVYGWHITDLVIYDKPKELSEFKRPCDGNCQECNHALWQTYTFISESKIVGCTQKVTAPQSWCYVEELEKGGAEQ